MIDPALLLTFVPAALALNLTPGADMMFCLGQGLRFGARDAWLASAGVATGGIVHVCLAGLGLSALIASAPIAFEVIRWIGVGYLLWLAVQALRSARHQMVVAAPTRAQHAYRTGLIINLTNPKVILFVLAFVPQFVRPDAGSVLGQFMVLGAVIALGGFVVNGMVGTFAGFARRKLEAGASLLHIVSAGIFSFLALRLAIFERA